MQRPWTTRRRTEAVLKKVEWKEYNQRTGIKHAHISNLHVATILVIVWAPFFFFFAWSYLEPVPQTRCGISFSCSFLSLSTSSRLWQLSRERRACKPAVPISWSRNREMSLVWIVSPKAWTNSNVSVSDHTFLDGECLAPMNANQDQGIPGLEIKIDISTF